jgi:hypothetical protein
MFNIILRGAVAGLVASASVDLHAWYKFASFDDIVRYDWKIALTRWGIGIVTGILAALGLPA